MAGCRLTREREYPPRADVKTNTYFLDLHCVDIGGPRLVSHGWYIIYEMLSKSGDCACKSKFGFPVAVV